jgi:hypothetical protein
MSPGLISDSIAPLKPICTASELQRGVASLSANGRESGAAGEAASSPRLRRRKVGSAASEEAARFRSSRAYDPAVADFRVTAATLRSRRLHRRVGHIEPDCLDAVLDDLRRVTSRVGIYAIATGPALKTWRTAVTPTSSAGPEWWMPKLFNASVYGASPTRAKPSSSS